MSTTELNRSTLQSKDKEELHQIANAMGVKPGSRARKAEIVDLILDLAGGATPKRSDGAGSGGPSDATPAGDAGTASGRGPTPRQRPKPAAAQSFSFDPMADARAEAERKRARDAGDPEPASPPIELPVDRGGDGSGRRGDGGRGDGAADGGRTESAGAGAQAAGRSSGGDRSEAGDSKAGGDSETGDSKAGGDSEAGESTGEQSKGGEQSRGDQPKGGEQSRGDQSKGGDQRRSDQQSRQNDPAEPGNRKRRRRGRNRDRDQAQGGGAPPEDWDGEPIEVAGWLDLRDDGYGFLRVKGMLPSKDDVYVPVKQARQFGLRKGDYLKGASRPAGRSEKNPALLRLDEVNGEAPDKALKRRRFEDLTPLFPDERLKLERSDDPTNMTARIVDLISPIGKGQRGLIVSPPKAGKTTIMKEIARSIELNNPEVKVLVLLVDERPEEVTDMRRWLKRGDVVASTFDRPSDEHTMVAELTIERAKRMVEQGEDVVIILDGITRLARAYNLAAPATGRIMSGGVDSGALYPPKRFFGAARNIEEGGSLTILATALVETGSKMDEVIFEEFKGTGNMELRLDRKTAERRIYPAIDVDASSTRHEELLFERKQLQQVWKLRRVLSGMAADGANAPGLELLIDRLKTFNSNDEFLAEVAKNAVG